MERRLVPFEALLTADELRLWNRFLELRHHDAASPTAPLLAQGGGLLPLAGFDRRIFAARLAEATGLRPHDLRHGAISNLALVLLAPATEKELLYSLTGWRPRQLTDLRERLVAKDPWWGMNELARLAGHRDPATTLESYIHINDLALGLHLRAAASPHPAGQVVRQLGLNRRSLPSRKTSISPETLRAKVLERLWITDMRSANAVTVPPPQPANEVTVSLILKIEAAICQGKSAPVLAEEFLLPLRVVNALFAFPRLKRLKGLRDRKAAIDLAQTVLSHPDARAWALQTQAAPLRGMVFHAPIAANLWIGPAAKILTWRTELQTSDPRRWGGWQRGPGVVCSPKRGGERLILTPDSPDGVSGMKLAKAAAWLVLATLEARNKVAVSAPGQSALS